jgi:hypothetical protein
MKRHRLFLPLLLLPALALLASTGCVDDLGATGTGPTDDFPMKVVEAPIDGIDILVREMHPPQYAVLITSGLPSGCARFEAAKVVSRTDTKITIRVTNYMPASDDIACTMIYGTQQTTIDLGSDFVSGREYTVLVNNESLTFTAQ